ncbi:MAG: hypothetical protein QW136_00070 [Nitrososphaerales archaeon]
MKIDLWEHPARIKCITTNGTVLKNGNGVMGRGCALEALQKWPFLKKVLGEKIRASGNHCQILAEVDGVRLIMFPVKHQYWEDADIELIKRSCVELTEMSKRWRDDGTWKSFGREILLPRPGCGNGRLSWENVKPEIEGLLPESVIIVYR